MNVIPITYSDLIDLPIEARRRRLEKYYLIAIKTRYNHGEPSRHSVRANPLPGQGFPTDLNVQCGTDIREGNPVGSVFVVWAKLSFDIRRDAYYLFSDYRWAAEKVPENVAQKLISSGRLGITECFDEKVSYIFKNCTSSGTEENTLF